MARNVTYSVVPRFKPGEKNDPPKYYAQAQASGDVDIREAPGTGRGLSR